MSWTHQTPKGDRSARALNRYGVSRETTFGLCGIDIDMIDSQCGGHGPLRCADERGSSFGKFPSVLRQELRIP